MNTRILLSAALLAAMTLMIVACSPTNVTRPWTGRSIDILQENARVQIAPVGSDGEAIDIAIKIEGETEICQGSFKRISTSSGWPGFKTKVQTYEGEFQPISSKACEDAVGGTGGVKRYVDISEPAGLTLFAGPKLRICNQSSGALLCFAVNTFSVEEDD